MKIFNLFRAAVIVALAFSMLPSAAAIAQDAPGAPAAQYVPGEVLVAFAPGGSGKTYAASAQALAGQTGADVAASFENLALLSIDPAADVAALASELTASGQVIFAQPNWVYSVPEAAAAGERPGVTLPQDATYSLRTAEGGTRSFSAKQLAAMRTIKKGKSIPAFPKEIVNDFYQSWGWDIVETDVVWRNSASSTAVCVIDTGVDSKHADLKSKVINGYDFINDDKQPYDDSGHGTHVAGIIAARNNNTTSTVLGVSNGKVVAVKALNAQGQGTSFSVAAAVRYCADRTDVRVINMSLGSPEADAVEYQSLRYAIVEKGKLVVAAAGNGGTTQADYPAAWAHPSTPPPASVGGANELAAGLIAVAAARSNPPYVRLWIDTNASGAPDGDEWYEYGDCATRFTNYGRHVELVAPGDQIYSTQPTSYPFYNNYMFGYAKGYDYDTGTSMAAPYAAAAAVRTLSVFNELTNAQLKERLISTGRALNYAYDTNGGININNAYASPGFNFGNAEDGVERAPFCWPNNAFGAAGSMTGARYLDVSAAMGRVGFYAEVYNASSGLPLYGAKIAITRDGSSKILDTGLVGKASPGAFIQNIPLPTGAEPELYHLWVSKSGYTAGYQWIDSPQLENPELNPDANKGGMLATAWNSIAVPPNKNVWVVLNWSMFSNANFDLAVWLPEDSAAGGVVSADRLELYLGAGAYRGPDWERGTLLKPEQFGGSVSPYAQMMHDGGDGINSDSYVRFDALQIKDAPAWGVQPYYSPDSASLPYLAFVTDYSGPPSGGLGGSAPAMNTDQPAGFAYPIVRVWYGGRMVNLARVTTDTPGCQNPGSDWWHAVNITGQQVDEMSTCGPSSILP